jgi:hypothetical protein
MMVSFGTNAHTMVGGDRSLGPGDVLFEGSIPDVAQLDRLTKGPDIAATEGNIGSVAGDLRARRIRARTGSAPGLNLIFSSSSVLFSTTAVP